MHGIWCLVGGEGKGGLVAPFCPRHVIYTGVGSGFKQVMGRCHFFVLFGVRARESRWLLDAKCFLGCLMSVLVGFGRIATGKICIRCTAGGPFFWPLVVGFGGEGARRSDWLVFIYLYFIRDICLFLDTVYFN